MATSNHIEQSLGGILTKGVLSILLVLAISAACIAPFDYHFFVDWVGTAFMAATPAQVILGLLWHNNKPDFVAKLSQPMKGLALTSITLLACAVVLASVMFLVGGGHGPTPMVIQYFIMTIVVIIWMVPILQCWPLTVINKDPFIFGILTLLFSYLLAYLLWVIFFDYSMLGEMGHPHYYADIDPKGLFDMWTALIFFVTVAGVVVVHFLFDLWPVEKLSMGLGQPFRGLIATVYILLLAYIVQTLFIGQLGMQPVDYMVRVPVCMIFGTFLVHNMMQFSLFSAWKQPARGLILISCAAIVGVVMYGFV